MGLIPATINDGTADHPITLRGQVPSTKSVKTEYFEAGEKLLLQTEYAVSPTSQTVQRNVLRVSDMLAVDTDGNEKPAIVNISIAHDKRHDEDELAALVTVAIAALPNVAARKSFVQRLP